jgi:isoleucyl-tRNA synthetase
VGKVSDGFDTYEMNVFYHAVHNFCAVDLSAFYLDVLKDRLYTSLPDDCGRRAAQTVLYELLTTLVRLIAPVLVHTAEEIWQYVPGGLAGETVKAESVHLLPWPEVRADWLDEALEARWERLLQVRDEVNARLEEARGAKLIGNSLEAAVTLTVSPEWTGLLEAYQAELPAIFIVSQVKLVAADGDAGVPFAARVERAEGEKCARCWMYHPETGQNPHFPEVCPRCAEVLTGLGKDKLAME